MGNYEDGSYSSTAGVTLIAKVLAGRCTMKYTRAAVGSGNLGEDESPKTAAEPAGYILDGKIAAITTPVDGECQVTVQIDSREVETGFFCTGILLYAEDPDEGEIPYTYLYLENEPEWIRPKDAAVGKLATFDLIVAVGDVDTVTATIDPNAIMTYTSVKKLIEEATVNREVEIPTQGWEETEDGTVYIDVAAADITKEMVPITALKLQSISDAQECRLCTVCQTLEGAIRFYAQSVPKTTLQVELTLLCATVSEAGGTENNSGSSAYSLPTATETTLGGVKVGEGLSIDASGVLSVDLEEISADNETVEAMLEDVLSDNE